MLYLKHQSNVIKFSYIISKLISNSIIITFLYANICIVCDFHKYFDFLIMFLIFKFFFHCLFIIKYDFTLFLISKVLVFKKFRLMLINTLSIVFSFKLNLHFIFKKPLIFLINVIVIMFIFSLFINAIIFFFSIDILIIIIIVFSIKYDAHNSFNLIIMSINFLYLRY